MDVLEAAGRQVWVPAANLCCGRPLYDFGMLDQAKAYLRDILQAMRPQIQAGIPVVGLEPSCVAVFRDELTNLFPNDKDAERLSKQTFLLSEYLNRKVDGYRPPRLERKALVHGHCHHKAVMGMDDETDLLKKIGLDFHMPEDGCCGMAGSFGFERGGHYDVSVACGERVLLPAVRKQERRRSSSPMVSAASSRSSKPRIARRCTWRRCCKWRCARTGRQGARSKETRRQGDRETESGDATMGASASPCLPVSLSPCLSCGWSGRRRRWFSVPGPWAPACWRGT